MYIPKRIKKLMMKKLLTIIVKKIIAVETLSDKINFFHKSIGIESANQLLRDIIDRDHKEFSQYDFGVILTKDSGSKVKPIDVIEKLIGLKMDKYLNNLAKMVTGIRSLN